MSSGGNTICSSLSRGCEAIAQGASNLHDGGLRCLGVLSYGTDMLVIKFIRENWAKLVAHALAWAVIICCSGFSHGFGAVALPLTIGLGAGSASGIIIGILMTNSCDPEGKNTPWNRLNALIDNLPPNGTRQVVFAIAVSVLLTVSAVYPYVLGGVFGLFIGNQLATKIILQQKMGSHEKSPEEIQEERITALERKMETPPSPKPGDLSNLSDKELARQTLVLLKEWRKRNPEADLNAD